MSKPCEGCEEETCQDCCPHENIEDRECVACGSDRTEDMGSMAYDMCKDRD